MNRLLTKRVLIAALIPLLGVAGLAYWLYLNVPQTPPDIVSISRFDFVFHKDLDLATRMAKIPDLRDVSLGGDDIEVRIWRQYSTPTLEGVFLKRAKGNWSGLHLRFKSDEHGEVQAAEVQELKTPKMGWDYFWGKIVEKRLFLLPLTPENECDINTVDGIVYVVEINQNSTYRNYQYKENHFTCRESKQMTEIGEIIGLEFDSGQEECTRYEWFACMTARKAESVPN